MRLNKLAKIKSEILKQVQDDATLAKNRFALSIFF